MTSPLATRYRLVHFETGSQGTESPAKDERLWAKIWRLTTSPLALALRILRVRPQVVHLNTALDPKGFWREFVYLLVCKALRRRIVYQVHGGSLRTLMDQHKLVRRLVRWTLTLPDAVVALASSEKQQFDRLCNVRRLVIIPNAINVEDFNTTAERIHSGKVENLVYLGRLVQTKGVSEIIQAVALLRKEPQFRNVELRIAGSGPAEPDLRRQIDEHGLQDVVRLVGPLHGKDKVEFLRSADVFVFPTYHPEGLPYTILESLAAGTPVVTTRVAGIIDAVIDGEHGVFVSPKQPTEIAKAIRELASSPGRMQVMSRQCVEHARRCFSVDRLARQFTELYDTVAA